MAYTIMSNNNVWTFNDSGPNSYTALRGDPRLDNFWNEFNATAAKRVKSKVNRGKIAANNHQAQQTYHNTYVRRMSKAKNRQWVPRTTLLREPTHMRSLPGIPLASGKKFSGEYGQVFVGSVTPATLQWMRSLRDELQFRAQRAYPQLGKNIAVKVAKRDPENETFSMFLKRSINEMYVQLMLTMNRKSSRYVPKLFLGGLYGNKFIIIMEHVHGEPLEALTARKYHFQMVDLLVIRQAVNALHKVGVHHGDLHQGNIILDPETKQVKIIDFGTAVYSGVRRKLAKKHIINAAVIRRAMQYTPNAVQLKLLDTNLFYLPRPRPERA